MRPILTALFLLAQFSGFAQTDTVNYHFNVRVMEVEGDLNNDDLVDKVVVTQDTVDENAPYRLQIFFLRPGGNHELIVSSTHIIAPEYPYGRDGFSTGDGFSEVAIKNSVLSVDFELLRGHFEHKFRYQNGNFELIGFSMVNSDGTGEMETIDFNLSTGTRTERKERYDTGEVLSNTTKKLLIRPLPRLQDVVPLENGSY